MKILLDENPPVLSRSLIERARDRKPCSTPGCRCHLADVKQACHPDKGFRLEYDGNTGVLRTYCMECNAERFGFLLAENGPVRGTN